MVIREYNELLYHGTTKSFHDKVLKEFGNYRMISDREVCLDNSLITPISYALQRTEQYNDEPVLLIVDPRLLVPESNFRIGSPFRVDFLNKKSYSLISLPKKKKKHISKEILEELRILEELVLAA